jgi:hypothetical protein
VHVADGLTPSQVKAYRLADNRVGEEAEWDADLLKIELSELGDSGFSLTLTGFDLSQLAEIFDENPPEAGASEGLSENYSRKIEAPIYEITGAKPAVSQLANRAKTDELLEEIDAAGLPDDVAGFLRDAAERHTVFNFRNIAEFYAHADEKTQALMERSALVIIDFNQAIEEGFVNLAESMMEQAEGSKARNYA